MERHQRRVRAGTVGKPLRRHVALPGSQGGAEGGGAVGLLGGQVVLFARVGGEVEESFLVALDQ